MHHLHRSSRPQLLRSGSILVASLAATSLATESAAASERFAIGDTVIVHVAALDLRTRPDLGYDVITVLSQGAAATVASEPVWSDGYTWYHADVGQPGWVAGDFLSRHASDEPGSLVIIVTDGPLDVRTEPSLGGAIITSVPAAIPMGVLQADGGTRADGDRWLYVRVVAENATSGCVADAFTAP